ncbi:MAG: L-seryl-tRNA(Ser) seleniumtransferase [Verrucomicrobiota bacterium]
MHDKIKSRSRRHIPAVNKVLEALDAVDLPRPVIVAIVRRELSALRESDKIVEFKDVFDHVLRALDRHVRSRLQSVINGTGVILHTNFGRSPLSPHVLQAVAQIGAGYSNLEFDLPSGHRGNRAGYLEHNLAILCGAEAATIVNNCAAALVVVVRHFTKTKPEVIISRGEIVQIGGGFRIGEIIEASGAKLREVGATNKTAPGDYTRAIGTNTAVILKVHRSNFFMDGFVESPETKEIAHIARKKRVPLVVDLGSGALESAKDLASAERESTPAEELKNGADLVCFSGDKLFGGPQAGIIAGKKRLIAALKGEPLFRALRCDKLTLAALQATVDLHLRGAQAEIPALALLQTSKDELRARAAGVIERLRGLPARISVGRGAVKVGGGTLPRSTISSVAIDIVPTDCSVNEFAARLRALTPPVVGYIASQAFKLDLRTILPHQDDMLVDAIRTACATSDNH